ncbi:MAG: sigma-70 family RNA polymerase sigma factor [Verrucomicrobiae bacterium]|nr:sigma-70 family RNA polymerase sigma factor [Verrucomicrobiae bacterium]
MQEKDAIAPEINDNELIARCQRGDLTAYEPLVNKYRERVYAQAFNLTRNADDAYDLCQETFVKAWKSISRFRGQSSFYTWLYRIATNLGIDLIRSKEKRQTTEFDDSIEKEETEENKPFAHQTMPSDEMQQKELGQAIDDAIAKLTPEHREVIVLREFEGLDYKDIAKAIGCSIGTVMSRLHYARAHLQKILKGYLK